MKAILVDDETYATELLELKLQHLGVEVLAKFNQPEAAIDYIRLATFDILFLDIEMPRMNGFQVLEQCPGFQFDVIFTTAYDQFAIQAFQVSALNYLLKPIQVDELQQALWSWQQLQAKHSQRLQRVSLPDTTAGTKKTRIALPVQEGYEILEVSSIIRCMADASYTRFYLNDGQTSLICRTLKEVESSLAGHGFVRVHQSHLINPAYIQKIVRQEGGYLIMADKSQVPVGKPKRDWLIEQFTTIERL
ncbi:LytTR family DNA-binding domain-containing protein [Spirosoma daeguense]